jgi:Na+/H+ antiporter NhaA
MKDEVTTKDVEKLAKALKPLVDTLAPTFLKIKELEAPVIRRQQWMNFTIMVLLAVAIAGLTYQGKIDGSAATGLLGSIIGYVFGFIYGKRNKTG